MGSVLKIIERKARQAGAADALILGKGTTRPKIKEEKISTTNSDPFDNSLPWWITDPKVVSPNVDTLIVKSYNFFTSNEVETNKKVDPIRRAVEVAAHELSVSVRFATEDIKEAISELQALIYSEGPLRPLYEDSAVTDIYIDGYDQIRCLRHGHAIETPFKFRSSKEYVEWLDRILNSVNKKISSEHPIVECVLNDKWRTRVSSINQSLLDRSEPSTVLRIPRIPQITFYDLLRTKTLPSSVAAWLAEVVATGAANILVVGPSGSGKTTFTTALLSSVGSDERICTIEDVPELFVPSIHVEKLLTRKDDQHGVSDVNMDELLRAALRRAPHRIVVGEIRDKEGPLFLRALETGHAGSIATVHAKSAYDGLWRLLDLVRSNEVTSEESLMRRISRVVNIVIALDRLNGKPCLMEILEILPSDQGNFVAQPIIQFEAERQGKRVWRLVTTQSVWLDRLSERGVDLLPGSALLGPVVET